MVIYYPFEQRAKCKGNKYCSLVTDSYDRLLSLSEFLNNFHLSLYVSLGASINSHRLYGNNGKSGVYVLGYLLGLSLLKAIKRLSRACVCVFVCVCVCVCVCARVPVGGAG
jgi:hypothetical protein